MLPFGNRASAVWKVIREAAPVKLREIETMQHAASNVDFWQRLTR
jgi:hypothetical protein